jgi:potassium uptake TrkH family protein
MLPGHPERPGRRATVLTHPARAAAAAFLGTILLGTVLLMLPVSTEDGHGASPVTALFQATSAVCVTGLTTVDTATYWSGFGETVLLVLFQVGGLGIMAMASLLGLVVSRRIGLRSRLNAAAETGSVGLGDIREVLFGIFRISLLIEAALAIVLTLRMYLTYDEPLGRAAYFGVFHAVSAFNNAGFSLQSDSLVGFAADPWIVLPVAFGVILGSLGFPVLFELARQRWRRRRRWTLHFQMTVWTSAFLLVGGMLFITIVEWNNPGTLGGMPWPDRIMSGFFASAMPRSGGFSTVDVAAMHPETLLVTIMLMFIGGGSASTAGGIKVTTFVLLIFVVIAEVRGEESVDIRRRRINTRTQRQALSVVMIALVAVMSSTLLLMELGHIDFEPAMFEVVSAAATVGLSTGITPGLPQVAQVILVVLMFLGRLGPVTLVSALALRHRRLLYQNPEGRPIIG